MLKTFKDGIFSQNPVFVQLLGMCPTLAVSTSVQNGIGMGLSATIVLVMSNILLSSLRHFIPAKIRIAAYIVVVAGLVTIIDLLLQAYFPALAEDLGIFIPLIVVNCIILARVEAFASKNTPFKSAVDGLGMGIGFTVALVMISVVRELLGNGSIAGLTILPNYTPMLIMILAPGGFLTLGIILALINHFTARRAS